MECYGTDGSIKYEENVVMNKWKEEFSHLYNPKEADGNESQKKFYDFIKKDNEDFEKLEVMMIWQLTQVLHHMKSERLFPNSKQAKRQASMELYMIL